VIGSLWLTKGRLALVGVLAAAALLISLHAVGNSGRFSAPSRSATEVGPDYRSVQPFLAGKSLYVSDDTQAEKWAKRNRATRWMAPILTTPQARWVNSEADLPSLAAAAREAKAAGTVIVTVAYAIPDRGCAGSKEGVASAADYRRFIAGMAGALSGSQAVVVLEPDAVAADCYDAARGEMLAAATTALTAAGQHVFIDAGHSGWRLSGEVAQRLIASGITEADGFAVNVASRATVAQARQFGEELSSLVGGRSFVVDTSRNGVGQEANANGDLVWCNPAKQALGPRPSTTTVGRNVGLLWIKNPGESDGNWDGCGDETAYPGLFSPRQARSLIASASWVGTDAKKALPEAEELPWTR